MGRIIPLKEIPSSSTLPGGRYRLVVDKLEEVYSSDEGGKIAKLMFKLTAKVVEPETQRNQNYFEQFCIGTNDDPEAEDLETWKKSVGAKQLKRLVNALGVPFGDEEDSDEFCLTCQGGEFIAAIVEKVEPAKLKNKATGVETDNPYAGTIRNESKGFWKIGEKEPGLDTEASSGSKRRTAPGRPPAGKDAPSDLLTCTGCRERVPRKDLPAHVDKHMEELKKANTAEAGAEDEE